MTVKGIENFCKIWGTDMRDVIRMCDKNCMCFSSILAS